MAQTRRGFLKASALAALGIGAAGAGLTAFTPKPANTGIKAEKVKTAGYQYEHEYSAGEWHYCACQRNCFDTCSIKCKVVDGRLVEVRGADNPFTKGGLCVKTQSYVDWCYREDRILYPLHRTSAKGPGATFERISWDDAIDEIVTRWKGLIAQYGGEAITWSRYQGNQGSLNRRVLEPLFYKMGATYNEGSMCNNGYVYSLPYTTGTVPVMRTEDIANVDQYLSWGHNPAAASLHTMKFIKEMRKKGGRIIVVNPVKTVECMWADLHVQLRPGTDVALALGVGNYLIQHGMYDREWVEQWSIGFDDYRANCAEWTPEKVAETCGIPAEQVGQMAEMLWERRANMCLKTGLQIGRRRNGGMTHISVKCLTGLVGHPEMYYNMTTSGGLQLFSNAAPAMQKQYMQGKAPTEAEPVGTIRNYSSPSLGKVLNGENFGPDHNFADNPIRSLFIFGNNPLVSHPNRNYVEQGLLRDDLFTIVHDMFMTEACNYADIILPAPSNFEYEEFNGGYGHNYAVHNEAIIAPLGESMANWELCNKLGRAMGYIDEAFFRDEEWFRDLFMKDKDFTYDEFVEKGWISVDPKGWDTVYESGFPTPSKKFQFASDELEHDHGTRAPRYIPDPESLTGDKGTLKKYPIALVNPSAKEFLNGCFGNLPDNNILFHENYLYMNPQDAAERGIQEGDEVRVFNDRGEVHRVARVIEGITGEHVMLTYKSTWESVRGKNRENINRVTGDAQADMGRGVTFMSLLVEVEKA